MTFIDTLKNCWQILLEFVKASAVSLFEFIKAHAVWAGIISGVSVVGSLVGCTAVIVYLPYDYFTATKRVSRIKQPGLRICLAVLKNLFALLLIVVGIAQLVLPGQGVLTILMGLVISDIPGKRRLERRLIRLPAILTAANAIRARFKRKPFVLETAED